MIKIVLGIVIICCSAYLGYGIERYYKIRLSIVEEYVQFLRYTESETTFLKTNIMDLIGKYSSKVNQFDALIKSNSNEKTCSIYLSKELNDEVTTFFNRLTTTDYNSISKLMKHSIEVAEHHYKVAEKEKVQKGELGRKLCILAGVGLLILAL